MLEIVLMTCASNHQTVGGLRGTYATHFKPVSMCGIGRVGVRRIHCDLSKGKFFWWVKSEGSSR